MSRTILLITPKTVKDRTALQLNVEERLVRPCIIKAQDTQIMPALGSALYNELLDQVVAGPLTGKWATLVDTYIVDCLVNYTMVRLVNGLSYQFYSSGVVRLEGDGYTAAQTDELKELRAEFKDTAEHYKERLIAYLKADDGNLFPNYKASVDDAADVAPEDSGYTCPIYLGPDETTQCSDGE
jgi:hypothetical protein